jgi:hypothetical protein
VTKADKREQKIRDNTKNVSLEDFEWLVRRYGKIEFGGKHPLATFGPLCIPYKRRNPVLSVYVEILLRIIDSLDKR